MKLNIITSNPGKVREYQEVFQPLGIDAVQLRVPYDEIQSSELEEVVKKGMKELKGQGIRDFIIDDSGLFVDHLNGFPGVWSAYAQRTIGNPGLLKLMNGVSNRTARFKCCIGCNINGKDTVVTGICEGTILNEERGNEGFGFDPIFSQNGTSSFSEISLEEKNMVSHRGNAVKLLLQAIENDLDPNSKP